MRKRSVIVIVMLFGVVFAGCKKKDPGAGAEGPDTTAKQVKPRVEKGGGGVVAGMPSKIGDAAWPLKGLEFIKGKAVKIEPGKVYIVEFWATWCGPCLTSIPHLTEIQHKYKDQKVTVIGISKEKVETVKPFVANMDAKMDYTVAVDVEGKANAGYMKAFNQNGIPHAFIVDGKGQIAWHGYPMDGLDEALADVVGGN